MAADDPVKFVATVYPVREVSLLGSADFAFWADRLAADHLVPMAIEGEARVMICASDAKYMGIRFRELSISIFCQRQDGNQQEAVYLLQAFNSMRWFAWVERRMFRHRTIMQRSTLTLVRRRPCSYPSEIHRSLGPECLATRQAGSRHISAKRVGRGQFISRAEEAARPNKASAFLPNSAVQRGPTRSMMSRMQLYCGL